MNTRRALALIAALALGPACNPPSSSPTADPSTPGSAAVTTAEVVARIGSEDVTLADLERWIKDDLYRREMEGKNAAALFEMRSEALERMIGERVLEAEAKRRGLSREAILNEEMTKAAPVTDEDVRAFYDENKARVGNQTLEQLAPRIKQHLQQMASQKLAEDLQRRLREAAGVEVKMEPTRVTVAAEGAARGPENAPVTLIEFSDYQCPFCRRAEPTVKQVLERYPTQVRFVYRHFPLEMHPRAKPASEAAACAGAQGKFWEYHEKVFAGSSFEDAELSRYATELGLDTAAFEQCRTSGAMRASVEKDMEAGRAAGVTGTPAFFINGIPISGARSLDVFIKAIDKELAAKGIAAPAS